MKVLVTGASGFIGNRLMRSLTRAGHRVVAAGRHRPSGIDCEFIAADFSKDQTPACWQPRLTGIDVAVNAAGILREQKRQCFDDLHTQGPIALFEACAAAGVGKVIQISALGADENARSRYHLSKKMADDFLLALPIHAVVVQPSLVYGPGGASARLFNGLACLPWMPLPGGGHQAVQPIHLDDLVQAIVALIESDVCNGQRVALVGPAAITLRQYLQALRVAMGFVAPARVISIPMPLARAGAAVMGAWPNALLDRDSLQMLERGNTASVAAAQQLLGRTPRVPQDFINPADAGNARTSALLQWWLPLLRISVALVWIATGLLSLGLYPVQDSHALLARLGIVGRWASVMLYGAALLDLALGVATLLLKQKRHWLWATQIALILGYTALITWRLPEFWLHPFGPILKNLPMLAVIGLLWSLENKGRG